jgi:rRNA maturation RNase YbeY
MEPPSRHYVTVLNESAFEVRTGPIAEAVATVLRQHGKPTEVVCVLLTDDDRIHALNRQYRAVDDATDVLTFPADDFPGAPLGDIAISVPYAERQALVRGVSLDQELGFLAIHGGLHLLGYDDETEPERAEMVDLMNQAAREAGLEPDEEWASLLHGDAA